jgi:SAM-dependent methyltransferase
MSEPGPLPPSTQEGYDAYFTHLMRRSRAGDLYRRRWLYPRLARRLAGSTLDVGCGIGDFLQFRRGTIGVDVNPRAVAYCRDHGLDARLMQPDRLPAADASLDSVLLDNVLEHIAQPGPLLGEIRRALKPGGRLLVGVPGRRGWDADADHKVYYDEALLAAVLAGAGFEPRETFHAPLWRSDWLARRLRQYCVFMLVQAPRSRTP